MIIHPAECRLLTDENVDKEVASFLRDLIFRRVVAFYGIIYLRPGHFSPVVHIQTLQHVLKQKIEINTPFMIVAENTGNSIRIRIRKH